MDRTHRGKSRTGETPCRVAETSRRHRGGARNLQKQGLARLGPVAWALAASLVLASCSVTISTSRPDDQPLVSINRKNEKDPGHGKQEATADRTPRADADKKRPSAVEPGTGNRPTDIAALPSTSKPGECFAPVLLPAKYKTVMKKVLVRAGTTAYEPVDAKIVTETRRIKVTDEQVTYKRVPARYKWVEKRIETSPAIYRTKTVPARYGVRKVRVLVRPARQGWRTKRGRVVADRGSATGVILQRVTIPAEYKTVEQRVVVEPAQSRKVLVRPAQYETVRQRVLVSPERVIKVREPAVYKTVTVRREVSPTGRRKVTIPPVYKTVARRELVEEERYAWKAVACEVAARKARSTASPLVRRVQRKLKRLVLYFGPIDGKLGTKTMAAVHVYQAMYGLPVGRLTRRTMTHMGVLDARKRPHPRPTAPQAGRPVRSS